MRLRFAPSPTGSLHLGNARTALFNWLLARQAGGTFVLRVEDTDTARDEAGSEASILEDLAWLGLMWDEGPDVGGPYGPYRQSERGDRYRDAAASLLASGAGFPCFCAAGGDAPARDAVHAAAGHRDPCRAVAPGDAARHAAGGEPHAVRFRVPARARDGGVVVRFSDRLRGEVAIPLAQVPDAVLLREDGRPTYNFAVVLDDAAMAIDLVLRGDDHLTNTSLQVLLYVAMGARPPEFAHVPMVLGPDGERLSKRHGATSVRAWRDRGVPPEALVNALALLGWAPAGDRTVVGVDEIVAEFDLARVGRSAAVFDPVKLDWISGQHLHALPAERLARDVAAWLVRTGRLAADDVAAAPGWVAEVAEFLRPALARLEQVGEHTEPLFHAGGPLDDAARACLAGPGSAAVVTALAGLLREAPPRDAAAWGTLKRTLQSATGIGGKPLFQAIRVALTGRDHGRELDRLVPLAVLGNDSLPARVPAPWARAERTLEAAR